MADMSRGHPDETKRNSWSGTGNSPLSYSIRENKRMNKKEMLLISKAFFALAFSENRLFIAAKKKGILV